MKKIIVLCSMIVALGFVTTGCGGDKPDTPAPAPAATDTPPADAQNHDDHEGHDHE